METEARILLVDDEEAILHMVKTVLTKEGFSNIDTCTRANQALRFMEERTYDLLILDVMLPDKSGFEFNCLCFSAKTRIGSLPRNKYMITSGRMSTACASDISW